jgi:hypothetical protein
MKSVWYDSENEVASSSKELAIKSAKVYLEKRLGCSHIETRKISDSQYVISGIREKVLRAVERVFIYEISVCETVKDYIELVKES